MSKPSLTISSNTTGTSSNNTNSPFVQRFDRRVPRQRRSTEAPMDFVYQSSQPHTSDNHHQSSSLSQIKPLRLIDLNGDHLISNHSSSSTWFNSHPPIQPHQSLSQMSQSHKRNYSQVESMDWEPSPPTSVVGNSSSDKDRRVMINTKERFVSKSMSSLPTVPTFTHPSAIVQPVNYQNNNQSSKIPTPARLIKQSSGPRQRSNDDGGRRDQLPTISDVGQDEDSSLEIEVVQSGSNSSYTDDRLRVKRQGASRGTSVSDDDDRRKKMMSSSKGKASLSDDEGEHDRAGSSDPKNRPMTLSRAHTIASPPHSTTTNNYLTIDRWTDHDRQKATLSRETPYTLLVYLQLVFNSSLVTFIIYLIFNLIWMIRNDINHKFVLSSNQLLQEIEICTTEYQSNRCFPIEGRTKFIEQHCINWEKCMNQNPRLISRSKIVAETFAEVMNGFVDTISWKTMLFIFLSIGAGVYTTNLVMNSYKAKWDPSRYSNSEKDYRHKARSNQIQDYGRSDHQRNYLLPSSLSFLRRRTVNDREYDEIESRRRMDRLKGGNRSKGDGKASDDDDKSNGLLKRRQKIHL
ncbi:Di-sulfide bridge nucleocytoplasmic transport domain-containing protein [Phakopsora pachyrhizi]|uniref:Di-sulfide bridge nucleocytoplasmic transport domain-domain-containing protein n=1 Tax=Phakopsora pachyrhizi TaxID=170000 RepID=A0AAV0B7P3_PHAPC|nr:Di-sulfide bridge nucleocytoplasmic transport domain-containing protein [Phakopsora pachyrhizi]CAH7681489.1 Di-sulfide bridge nucleocytoplasmic transport domain-domain-containing protein [Phakopsora pachyrhizi]